MFTKVANVGLRRLRLCLLGSLVWSCVAPAPLVHDAGPKQSAIVAAPLKAPSTVEEKLGRPYLVAVGEFASDPEFTQRARLIAVLAALSPRVELCLSRAAPSGKEKSAPPADKMQRREHDILFCQTELVNKVPQLTIEGTVNAGEPVQLELSAQPADPLKRVIVLPLAPWSELETTLPFVVLVSANKFNVERYPTSALRPVLERAECLIPSSVRELSDKRGVLAVPAAPAFCPERSPLKPATDSASFAAYDTYSLYARANLTLATSYREWASGVRAVLGFQAALQVSSRKKPSQAWAEAQSMLSVAYFELSKIRSDSALARLALAAAEQAHAEINPDESPLYYAGTLCNVGIAQVRLAELTHDAQAARRGRDAFQKSLQAFSAAEHPEAWSDVQNNLGAALASLAEFTGDSQYRNQAISAFRAAPRVRTRTQLPLKWAQTQQNLGRNLAKLGQEQQDESLEQQGISALAAVIDEYPRERFPADWAEAQTVLGFALVRLEQADALPRALSAFQSALQVFDRAHFPEDWANSQHGIGLVQYYQGKFERSLAQLESAVATLQSVREILSAERQVFDRALVEMDLARTFQLIEVLKGSPACKTLEQMLAVRDIYKTRDRRRFDEVQHSLGHVLEQTPRATPESCPQISAAAWRVLKHVGPPPTHCKCPTLRLPPRKG